MKHNPTCKDCGVDLTPLNWPEWAKANYTYRCNACEHDRRSKWKKDNIETVRESSRAYAELVRRQRGGLSMKDNRECSSFLGVHITEEVLSNVFNNVVRMPYGNPGYDFVCGNGYLIDTKSSCISYSGRSNGRWAFTIKKNKIADYFVLLAFDDRESLTPLYLWLIPGHVINHLVNATISKSTIDKWDEYRLDIDKVITCCNAMKEGDI